MVLTTSSAARASPKRPRARRARSRTRKRRTVSSAPTRDRARAVDRGSTCSRAATCEDARDESARSRSGDRPTRAIAPQKIHARVFAAPVVDRASRVVDRARACAARAGSSRRVRNTRVCGHPIVSIDVREASGADARGSLRGGARETRGRDVLVRQASHRGTATRGGPVMCVVCDVQSVCNVCAKEARARRLNDTVTFASGWRRIRRTSSAIRSGTRRRESRSRVSRTCRRMHR